MDRMCKGKDLMRYIGGWNCPQARTNDRYLSRLPPPEPLRRIPQGQRRPPQGLPVQTHPLPTQGRSAQEGRRLQGGALRRQERIQVHQARSPNRYP